MGLEADIARESLVWSVTRGSDVFPSFPHIDVTLFLWAGTIPIAELLCMYEAGLLAKASWCPGSAHWMVWSGVT